MGILANTVSICHFRVQGELSPSLDIYDAATELLTRQGFNSIDDGTEELSLGWVKLDDSKVSTFDHTSWRERYLCFSMRRDQRKVPTALLKEHLEKAMDQYKADNGVERVPKQRREELKELVRVRLLAKTLPDPKVYDVVWDTQGNILTFTTLSTKTIEILEDLFKKTFEGLRLTALHPYERAMSCLDSNGQRLLAMANKAQGDNFLELIRENRWLGTDFMGWLLYQTLNGDSEYRVNQPGPELHGAPFVAYIDDKVVLCGEGESGTQMITVNGPQDRFSEVKSALRTKKITEATIHLQTQEKYCLTLKGELFHFASLAAPPVKIEIDNTVDEMMERDAVFFERMAVLSKGLQLFDSLFAAFLKVRLDGGWYAVEAVISNWVNEA